MAQTYAEHLAKCKECHKRLHDERVRWDLCIRCGQPLEGVKTLQCSVCLAKEAERREKNREKIREYMRKRVADHRARGLCIYCNEPAVRGGKCEYHGKYYNRSKSQRSRNQNDGSDN